MDIEENEEHRRLTVVVTNDGTPESLELTVLLRQLLDHALYGVEVNLHSYVPELFDVVPRDPVEIAQTLRKKLAGVEVTVTHYTAGSTDANPRYNVWSAARSEFPADQVPPLTMGPRSVEREISHFSEYLKTSLDAYLDQHLFTGPDMQRLWDAQAPRVKATLKAYFLHRHLKENNILSDAEVNFIEAFRRLSKADADKYLQTMADTFSDTPTALSLKERIELLKNMDTAAVTLGQGLDIDGLDALVQQALQLTDDEMESIRARRQGTRAYVDLPDDVLAGLPTEIHHAAPSIGQHVANTIESRRE